MGVQGTAVDASSAVVMKADAVELRFCGDEEQLEGTPAEDLFSAETVAVVVFSVVLV
jgi:hypothetical protein